MLPGYFSRIFCPALIVFLSAPPVWAATLRGRACYQLGEQDTLAQAKEQARLQALRSLVSSYKTFVFSSTETKNLILQKDQLQAIAGGPLRKLECSFPPVANYSVCAACVAEVSDEEMNHFLAAHLRALGVSPDGQGQGMIVSKKTGSLSIQANTGGNLSINGKAIEAIKPADTVTVDNLPIGKHEVTLSVDGRTLSKEIFISAKEVTPLYFRDPVAAVSQGGTGELLDQETLAKALSYLGESYDEIDRLNALLRNRVLGRRMLVKGIVFELGEVGKSFAETSWYSPKKEEMLLKPNMPMVIKVGKELNVINAPYAFAMSNLDFPYSNFFKHSFYKNFPELYKKYIDKIPQVLVCPKTVGPLGSLTVQSIERSFWVSWMNVDGCSDAKSHMLYSGLPYTPLVEFVGTVQQITAARSGSGMYLPMLVFSDVKIVSINNADPDTIKAEIFEREKEKEKNLDEIFSTPGKPN